MAGRRSFVEQGEEVPKGKLTRSSLQELASLARYLRPYRVKFIFGLLFLALSALTTLAFPAVIGNLVDAALRGKGTGFLGDINTIALVLVGILLVQAVFSFFRIVWFVEVGEKTLADLRRAIYTRLIRLPMAFFGQRRVGELASRLSSDISQIQDTFTTTLSEFLRGIGSLVVGLALIVAISPRLTLLMVASFPVLVVLALYFGKFIRRLSREAQDKLAAAGVVVEESLQGIQNVKAFTNEDFETQRYGASIQQVVNATLRGAKYRGAFASFVIFALFGAIVLVMWYGSLLVQRHDITVGELTSFLIYTLFVGAAVGNFGDQYAQLLKALGATERVRALLNEPIEPLTSGPIAPQERLKGAVSYNQVSFYYPSRPEVQVVRDVSFTVEPGEKVALVGPSGAGKSTLITLLLRFYDPTAGTILLDGRPAQHYDLAQLRSQMAVVPQEVLLFGGTIRENIAYGKVNATEAEIAWAAKQAYALDFIESFPQGMDTVVGERGIKLSGGQRQRIAIARATLRNPTLLLLDEATSSLDSESERVVQQALEELMVGRTTFIIAHRLSTVRSADKILVLQHGTIVETGTHAELMGHPTGLYRSLATLQFSGELQPEAPVA